MSTLLTQLQLMYVCGCRDTGVTPGPGGFPLVGIGVVIEGRLLMTRAMITMPTPTARIQPVLGIRLISYWETLRGLI